ncbi:MAG: 30S ribosomal protein S4 [Patescibacteria group bacterium]
MKIGPKYKICRRLNEKVFGKCQTTKFSISGSANKNKKSAAPAGRRALSEYGSQLLEKQKARYTYGVSEHQFSRYVRSHQDQTALYSALETRLDNVVFRLGWAPSRAAARQAITHGHITVNDHRLSIPSYAVKIGDKIRIKPASKNSACFRNLDERLRDYQPPAWLQAPAAGEGVISTAPLAGSAEMNLNFGAIIDFYSRV